MTPILDQAELKLLVFGFGLVTMLLVLFWPRHSDGVPHHTSWLVWPAVLVGLPVAISSIMITRQDQATSRLEAAQLKRTNLQLSSDVTNLQLKVASCGAQVESLSRTSTEDRRIAGQNAAQLESKLRQAMDDLSSSYKEKNGLIDLQLKETAVRFSTDSSLLECSSKENLSRMVGYLSRFLESITSIIVVGHTDATGQREHPEHNEKLGKDRAETVVKYLKQSGIPENLMTGVSKSCRQPYNSDRELTSFDAIMAANSNPEQMRQNRRVQFLIQLKSVSKQNLTPPNLAPH